ncbi:MAG: bifunctional riboflavin kinase/FAD synthetase [Desulfovibrio sp.]|nr:bifunctional riboflavin kinase/FAD synthetase [Desulfovibrio sp.]
MQIAHTPKELAVSGQSVLTIGNFDGVHKGHQSLILRTLEIAKKQQMTSIVVTFWPHPRRIVHPQKPHFPLSTRQKRLELLAELGVDCVLELDFTPELARQSPEEFVQNYLLALSLRHLVTGYDFCLGRGRSGHTEELRAIGAKYGFRVEQMPALKQVDDIVSSTRLRALIAQGDLISASQLLGRLYEIEGEVIHGFGRGEKLGFPTANLAPPDILLPANGVYAAYARCAGRYCQALVNIGHNPTFGEQPLCVEAFLLESQGSLYGQTLNLAFVSRLREEIRFASPADLVKQIGLDLQKAKAIFAQRPNQ